ncbi:hypothetical protein [Streptomyces sp. AK010]|uniref:hypothetical protein n=1 Tax=Streptomyces sp. AK010 TaxID=2723074 RepID=UPI00161A05C1|nr:hypothetical protein [Streptomyces sp. AK010]MBB6421615.1 hypothetical protein [Streptomyces sp. AK010]
MNVTRNVKPRNLADWPAWPYVALFFWSWAALVTFGPLVVMTVLSVAWATPLSLEPLAQVAALQVGLIAATLTPLYFAPGFRRLARFARVALLGPLDGAVSAAVFLCLGRAHV